MIVGRARLVPGGRHGVELALKRGVFRGVRTCCDPGIVRAVEEHRRCLKEIEDEDQDACAQDEELKGDLHVSAHQQRVPRLVDRFRGEIPLNLALIASEVRQHQKQAADQAGPERVRLTQIKAEVDRVQPSCRACQIEGLA